VYQDIWCLIIIFPYQSGHFGLYHIPHFQAHREAINKQPRIDQPRLPEWKVAVPTSNARTQTVHHCSSEIIQWCKYMIHVCMLFIYTCIYIYVYDMHNMIHKIYVVYDVYRGPSSLRQVINGIPPGWPFHPSASLVSPLYQCIGPTNFDHIYIHYTYTQTCIDSYYV
jgi:hypothetical protein